jgi:predicted DNA-binding transcriptional regulator AlpA
VPRRPDPLLPSCPPAALRREGAASYCGIGATKFDEMVKDGRMPKPKRVDARLIWLRAMLDAALYALPDDGEAAVPNPWHRRQEEAA